MTFEQVATVASASMTAAMLPFGSMPPRLHKAEGRLLWTVGGNIIGSGCRVEVDDALGIAGPIKWWGVR